MGSVDPPSSLTTSATAKEGRHESKDDLFLNYFTLKTREKMYGGTC